MPGPSSMTRRSMLMGLAAIAPAAQLLAAGGAGADAIAGSDAFLRTSLIITGAEALSPEIAQRVRDLLNARVAFFETRLSELDTTMQRIGGSRAAMLGGLSDDQVDFALQVARPWYLGYVGNPSSTILQDDAVFVTFLEAQAYEKIIDVVARPTYPRHRAGWWDAVPAGVEAPPMPDGVKSWTFHPGGPQQILPPDPAWRDYATTKFDSTGEARRAKPGSEAGPPVGSAGGEAGAGGGADGGGSDSGAVTGAATGAGTSGGSGNGGSDGGSGSGEVTGAATGTGASNSNGQSGQ